MRDPYAAHEAAQENRGLTLQAITDLRRHFTDARRTHCVYGSGLARGFRRSQAAPIINETTWDAT